MTITKHDGELIATCDDCGDEHAGGCQDDFRKFVQELQELGWKISKDEDGQWTHTCPACNEE